MDEDDPRQLMDQDEARRVWSSGADREQCRIQTLTEYDALGRVIRESLPFAPGGTVGTTPQFSTNRDLEKLARDYIAEGGR